MCGILVAYCHKNGIEFKNLFERKLKLTKHRGPDCSGIYIIDKTVLLKNDKTKTIYTSVGHNRLAVMGVESLSDPLEKQPFVVYNSDILGQEENECVLTVNGEIFNYEKIKEETPEYNYKTRSDCEVILPLLKKYGTSAPMYLDGEYSFVAVSENRILVARDPIGIVPLYMGTDKNNVLWFSSELKSILEMCPSATQFPPGHVFTQEQGLVPYINKDWFVYNTFANEKPDLTSIRNLLIEAVRKRMMVSETVDFGVLLSGGLDSSLIATIANTIFHENPNNKDKKMKTFSVGIKGSPDIKYARIVADHLGTEHYEYNFTVKDGLSCLSDVIYHIESYDVTTIRASTPMYILAKSIRRNFPDLKMCLTGEGSDEILGGYLYYKGAPSGDELHTETKRALRNLYKFDCLRANKSTMASGLELRFPFLDQAFLDNIMNINGMHKLSGENKIEKYILRKAFETTPEKEWLPEKILWRQKEAMSDGVGYSWVDKIKEVSEKKYTDIELNVCKIKYFKDPPLTKEALYFMDVFEGHFPEAHKVMQSHRWLPQWADSSVGAEPSARALKWHDKNKAWKGTK